MLAEIAVIEKAVKPLIEKETKAVAARKENAGGLGFGPPGGYGRSLRAPGPGPEDVRGKAVGVVAAQLAGKSKGFTPQQFGFGPPGGFQRPLPGDVLPAERAEHTPDDRAAEEGTGRVAEEGGRGTGQDSDA